MAANIVRGEIDTAPVASETRVVTPSASVRSIIRARGLSLTLSPRLTSGGSPCRGEAGGVLDTVAISIAKIRLRS
jgi:hypothetical protein